MSTVALRVACADTGSDRLSFALGLSALPALASLTGEIAGLPVELRVLGASHQVVAGPITETVACLPEPRAVLPSDHTARIGEWSYTFVSSVSTYGKTTFTAEARDLRARLEPREDAIVGVFPGPEHAMTALELTGDGWRTWHVYPETLEIVTTRTGVSR